MKNTTLILFSVDGVQFAMDIGHGGYDPIRMSPSFNQDSLVRITYKPGGYYKTTIFKFESIEQP
jgi:hypothetical protein